MGKHKHSKSRSHQKKRRSRSRSKDQDRRDNKDHDRKSKKEDSRKSKWSENPDSNKNINQQPTFSIAESNSSIGLPFWAPGLNPNILKTLNDPNKVKRKVPIPPDPTFNYIGLIIGPKGVTQKKLEEETGCKILVRGKGSQKEGQPPQPDDNEDLHVLVVGDNQMQVASACEKLERILLADNEERNRIRQEQMKIQMQIQAPAMNPTSVYTTCLGNIHALEGPEDQQYISGYGPPSLYAYAHEVPHDCVSLIIGKYGETIRRLKEKSKVKYILISKDCVNGTLNRQIFIEGDSADVKSCIAYVDEIVESQKKLKQMTAATNPLYAQNLSQTQVRIEYQVHDQFVALVIGKKGATIKALNERTGAFVVICKTPQGPAQPQHQVFSITGTEHSVEAAKKELETLIENARRQMGIAPVLPMIASMDSMVDPMMMMMLQPPQNPITHISGISNTQEGQTIESSVIDPNQMDPQQMVQHMIMVQQFMQSQYYYGQYVGQGVVEERIITPQ